ncbi:MAG: hypothetical protein ACRCZD_08280 [Phycicoccus sp.]
MTADLTLVIAGPDLDVPGRTGTGAGLRPTSRLVDVAGIRRAGSPSGSTAG